MNMKMDLYTKVVLTVSAGCLVYLVMKDVSIVPGAQAQQRSSSQSEVVDVNIVSVAGKMFTAASVGRYSPAFPVHEIGAILSPPKEYR